MGRRAYQTPQARATKYHTGINPSIATRARMPKVMAVQSVVEACSWRALYW